MGTHYITPPQNFWLHMNKQNVLIKHLPNLDRRHKYGFVEAMTLLFFFFYNIDVD
jgi:hypothetical protein